MNRLSNIQTMRLKRWGVDPDRLDAAIREAVAAGACAPEITAAFNALLPGHVRPAHTDTVMARVTAMGLTAQSRPELPISGKYTPDVMRAFTAMVTGGEFLNDEEVARRLNLLFPGRQFSPRGVANKKGELRAAGYAVPQGGHRGPSTPLAVVPRAARATGWPVMRPRTQIEMEWGAEGYRVWSGEVDDATARRLLTPGGFARKDYGFYLWLDGREVSAWEAYFDGRVKLDDIVARARVYFSACDRDGVEDPVLWLSRFTARMQEAGITAQALHAAMTSHGHDLRWGTVTTALSGTQRASAKMRKGFELGLAWAISARAKVAA